VALILMPAVGCRATSMSATTDPAAPVEAPAESARTYESLVAEYLDLVDGESDAVARIEAESLAGEAEQQAAIGEIELATGLVREAITILRTGE